MIRCNGYTGKRKQPSQSAQLTRLRRTTDDRHNTLVCWHRACNHHRVHASHHLEEWQMTNGRNGIEALQNLLKREEEFTNRLRAYELQRDRSLTALGSRSRMRSRNFNCVAQLSRFDVVFFAVGLTFIGFALGLTVGFELAINGPN